MLATKLEIPQNEVLNEGALWLGAGHRPAVPIHGLSVRGVNRCEGMLSEPTGIAAPIRYCPAKPSASCFKHRLEESDKVKHHMYGTLGNTIMSARINAR